ncbi:flagellar assembly protein T N-terminal domain-containing protein [bacterium]|nr:flagellar assembly protein T N-terminal domain-containing protein [bacterium]
MKKTILFCGILFLFTGLIFAQDTKTVVSEGVANLGSDRAAARDKAIEDALRRAVEQAVGTMVESETSIEDYKLLSDRIYSQSAGYVKKYEVISENADGGLLRVRIQAEVDSGYLNNDLAAIGLLHRRMKYPRVVVMIAEDNILRTNYWEQVYSLSNSQSEAVVIARLKGKGFNVVDPGSLRKSVSGKEAQAAWQGNYQAAGGIGKKTGAEIAIIGQAISTRAASNIYGSDMLSMSTTINVQAVKSGTGEIIAQASGQGTAAHINEVMALQESMKKASDKVADAIIGGILQTWEKESSGTRTLALEIHDITKTELDRLKVALEKLRGVTEVIVREFSDGDADINLVAKTDAQELSDSISKAKFSGFRLTLLESSTDRLEYRVTH